MPRPGSTPEPGSTRGVDDGTRTHDPRDHNPVLPPAELRPPCGGQAGRTSSIGRAVPGPAPARMAAVPTVLVVEDDAVLAQVMRRHLAEAGFDVETASDGDRALKKLRFERPN